MAFSSGSGKGPMADINVTPLVDVMLVLLIIFIVTAPIMTYPIDVALPQDAPAGTYPVVVANILASALIGLAITSAIVGLGSYLGLDPRLAKLGAIAVSFQITYILRRSVVFA